MIIVSNVRVPGKSEQHMSYNEFVRQAFSDDGLQTDEFLMININETAQDVYDAAKGETQQIGWFTLTGMVPPWAEVGVQDWRAFAGQQQAAAPTQQAAPAPEIPVPPVPDMDYNQEKQVSDLLNDSMGGEDAADGAKVYVFGSSKGGTGKTFTALISTYRYAKMHPYQRIALVDFDIIDGQVGISIHKVQPTLRKYLSEYQKGYQDFKTMSQFAVHARDPYPQNVDFYLAPSNNARINDDKFWINVIQNCVENYDVVVFDTGIDYINLRPISYVYKCADKILLITTTSIKSVNSVGKQIDRLKGLLPSKDQEGRNVFSAEDEIAPRLNIVITQMMVNDKKMNTTIFKTLTGKANVVATFGVITDSVQKAEFYGMWDIFDRNMGINKALDDIMAL